MPDAAASDLVIADNLRQHTAVDVKEAVVAVGVPPPLPPAAFPPISIPSNSCLLNALRRPMSRRRLLKGHPGRTSPRYLTASHQMNARATSHPQAM